jgi:quinol monooxygenase YgiN
MELDIIARFHARPGSEEIVKAALLEGLIPTRAEPGCLGSHVYRSIRDPLLFFIHSRWKDEAVFEIHAELPHTVKLIEVVTPLIDHPFDANRTVEIA